MYTNQFLPIVFNISLFILLLVLSVLIFTLLIESISAFLAATFNQPFEKYESESHTSRPTVAILIPAHNEAAGIEKTLSSLQSQITEGDRIVVVADNCTDNTAEIARNLGVIAIERQNENLQGKGFALDRGLKFLKSDPPQVVMIIDADCTIKEGSIEEAARLTISTQKPVQTLNLLELPEEPSPKDLVSVLAFTVKNLVRPLGLKNLNLPCMLTGTGMAFAWSIIEEVSLASDNLVEDMQMSIDLAISGYTTLLCTSVKLTGQEKVTKSQRTRWEHGHLKTIKTQVPRLVKAAVEKKRLDLLLLSLDLCVPPLSLLVFIWIIGAALSLLNVILGLGWGAIILFAAEGFLLFLSIFIAYIKFASDEIPLKSFVAIPFYLLWKIPIYFSFLLKPQTKWIRSARVNEINMDNLKKN